MSSYELFGNNNQSGEELQVITEQPRPTSLPDINLLHGAPIQHQIIRDLGLNNPIITNGNNDFWYGCLNCLYGCCCRYDCVTDMSLYETITRYEEEFVLSPDQFLERVTQNRFMISILESLYKSFPDFFFTYLPTGSLREGFGKLIPSTSVLATDYDILLVPDAVTVGEYGGEYTEETPVFTAIDAPKDHLAGYLWLKLEDTYLTQWEKLCLRRHIKNEGCSLLSSSKWREMLKDTIRESTGIKETTRINYNEPESSINVVVENNGPALTVDITASHPRCCKDTPEKRAFFYADFTLGLHCIHWPKRANGFLTSEHRQNWPSQRVVDLIKRLGCHVVPKSSTQQLIKLSLEQEQCTTFGRSPGLEWRYSFSQPEIILSANIPRAARTAFLAFKATVKRHFNKRFGKIPSYALKCIMFRVVEKSPAQFWDGDVKETVEVTFIEMLTQLKDCLETGFCPNYWIPNINLFDKLCDVELMSKRALMSQVYSNPKKFVANEWLEYVRYVRLNCCYCGNGYNNMSYQVLQVLQDDSDTCVCCRFKCSYHGDECPCSSFTYKNDPLSLDVY